MKAAHESGVRIVTIADRLNQVIDEYKKHMR